MTDEKLRIIIEAVDKASKDLGKVKGSLGDIGKVAGGLALTGVGVAAAAATTALYGIGAAFQYSLEQAMDAQEVNAQLEAVLASTGGAAGITAEEANELATALSQVTRFDDEAVLSAETVLLQFSKISEETFPDATEAALNLAERMGLDLPNAAKIVGKTLEGELGSLGRYGIVFDKATEDAIKGLMETNQTAEAQKIILDELEKKFGGAAKAAGETLPGQLDILRNSLNNVAENVGGVLIPVLSQALSDLMPVILDLANQLAALVQSDQFKAWLTETANFIVAQLIPAIMRFTEWLINDLVPGVQKASEWFSANLLPALTAVAQFLGVVMPPIMAAFVKGWEIQFKMFELVKKAIDSVIASFKLVLDWIGKVASGLTNLKLPDWLTPGSPTPLELGLIGINQAMAQLASSTLPSFSAGLSLNGGLPAIASAGAGGLASAGANVTLVYSPTFSMADAEEFQNRLQPFIERGLRAQRRG